MYEQSLYKILPNHIKESVIKKTSNYANVVTVAAAGGDQIDAASTQTIDVQYTSISIISDGSTWWIR